MDRADIEKGAIGTLELTIEVTVVAPYLRMRNPAG